MAAQWDRCPTPGAHVPLATSPAVRSHRLAQAARSIVYSLWSPPSTGFARTARAGTGRDDGSQFTPSGDCMLSPRWERTWS
jgi:hypothetical protein